MNGWEDQNEWLETDGLGGFASGTVGQIRTRRYHGLLLAAATPPDRRFMLVNGLEACVKTAAGTFPLSSHRYAGQVVYPEGFRLIEDFTTEPWPTWRFRFSDGTRIEQKIIVAHGGGSIPYQIGRWQADHVMKGGGTVEQFNRRLRQLYFDTCLHARKSLEMLVDIAGSGVRVVGLPDPPEHLKISHIDVVVRLVAK